MSEMKAEEAARLAAEAAAAEAGATEQVEAVNPNSGDSSIPSFENESDEIDACIQALDEQATRRPEEGNQVAIVKRYLEARKAAL